jgi:hypothetical protein
MLIPCTDSPVRLRKCAADNRPQHRAHRRENGVDTLRALMWQNREAREAMGKAMSHTQGSSGDEDVCTPAVHTAAVIAPTCAVPTCP